MAEVEAPKITAMASRVDLLTARERKVRLKEPVVVDGRTFTQELGIVWEPYHNRWAASVADFDGGKIVTLKEAKDVSTEMRVALDGVQYAIESITPRVQAWKADDGKGTALKFIDLRCVPIGE